MPDASAWIAAVRTSHDRLAALLAGLSAEQVTGPSYASEWSIADTASHIGSQAEIFGLFLDAGLSGGPTPGGDAFGPIWERWNALAPADQAAQSVVANEALVSRLEGLPDADAESFALSMFGMDLDLAGFAGMRLGEHALHTWDVAVALDPAATVSPDAVELLVDSVGRVAARFKPVEGAAPVAIDTVEPARRFQLTLDPEIALADRPAGDADDAGALTMPAEAFIRLVYGRLDAEHTPADVADDDRLPSLRAAFPGF